MYKVSRKPKRYKWPRYPHKKGWNMTEEVKNAVTEQDVGNPEAQPQAESSQESQEPVVGSKEFNFRELENKNKEVERKLHEQEAMTKELLEAVQKQNQPPAPKEEVLPDLRPDDIPEWQQVQQHVARAVEKGVKESLAKQEQARLPKVVKERYSDFEEVVTDARIKQLEKDSPELAQAFSVAKDPYTAAYKYLKAVHAPQKQDPVAIEEAQKIVENSNKPPGGNAIGQQGVLKNANLFQKRSKEEVYREAMRVVNGG